jgi:hypothetical protein
VNTKKKQQRNARRQFKAHVPLFGREKAVFLYLAQNCGTGNLLPAGLLQQAAARFYRSTRLISKIWKTGKAHRENPEQLLRALSPKKKGNCERKRKELPSEEIKALSVKKGEQSDLEQNHRSSKIHFTRSCEEILVRQSQMTHEHCGASFEW